MYPAQAAWEQMLQSPHKLRPLATISLLASLAFACKDSGTAPVKAGPPAVVRIVSGDAQPGKVGEELPQPLVVKVMDANDNPVSGQVINFRVTAGGGTVFGGASSTNSQGIAQERWTLGTVAGAPQALEVRAVDNSTGAPLVFGTFTAIANAGPPASAVKEGGDAQAGAAAPLSPCRSLSRSPTGTATRYQALQYRGRLLREREA